jgi:hypothetical protein
MVKLPFAGLGEGAQGCGIKGREKQKRLEIRRL